ncbi:MAG TPA: glutathionylspermidine synthase family protein [Tepidisphaeraceae bacterium]|nr:glutathionylspermidine synthase family protein [Tepidisphaeraceae bacterium]
MIAALHHPPPQIPGHCSLACAAPLSAAEFADVRIRTIFDCGKYDPQVGDISVLSRFPLVIEAAEYESIAQSAQLLHAEALAAEAELIARPDLHRHLGLPWSIRRALAHGSKHPPSAAARHMRFDFHPTRDGWRISEVNSDVPGGFIEASGFSRLMADHYPGLEMTGDPAGALANAMAAAVGDGAVVALVHATAYTDDRQVMAFLAERAKARGLKGVLLAPDQLRWSKGRASSIAACHIGPLDLLMRFFPGEWLCNLPRACGWKHWLAGARTPMSNPASALLTQSKRFPLVWDKLSTPLPTWRKLLPKTIDPRGINGRAADWVLKPAMGRVGNGIGLSGITDVEKLKSIHKEAFGHSAHWAAQAPFEAVALDGPDGPVYPCLGIYTIDGSAAGTYARIARRPLIDDLAQDIAVLRRRTPCT